MLTRVRLTAKKQVTMYLGTFSVVFLLVGGLAVIYFTVAPLAYATMGATVGDGLWSVMEELTVIGCIVVYWGVFADLYGDYRDDRSLLQSFRLHPFRTLLYWGLVAAGALSMGIMAGTACCAGIDLAA